MVPKAARPPSRTGSASAVSTPADVRRDARLKQQKCCGVALGSVLCAWLPRPPLEWLQLLEQRACAKHCHRALPCQQTW